MSDKEEPMHFIPQEGVVGGSGDRRSNPGAYYTDAHWHKSKAVSLTNVLGFSGLFLGGLSAYYSNQDTLKTFINASNMEIATINIRLEALEKSKEGDIPPSTLLEKFKSNKDKIEAIAIDVDEIAVGIRENRKSVEEAMSLLIELPNKIKSELKRNHE